MSVDVTTSIGKERLKEKRMNGLSTSVVRRVVSSQRPTQLVAGILGRTARRKSRWLSQEKSFRPSLEFDLKIDGTSNCFLLGFYVPKTLFLVTWKIFKNMKHRCVSCCVPQKTYSQSSGRTALEIAVAMSH